MTNPERAHEQNRSDHLGYIKAVAHGLRSLRIKTGRVQPWQVGLTVVLDEDLDDWYNHTQKWQKWARENRRPEPMRAATIDIPHWDRRPWYERGDVAASVYWDEEYGWIVTKTFEISGGIGRGEVCHYYGLDLALVPDPVKVALRVEAVFKTTAKRDLPFETRPHRVRNATDHDPRLETALAAYLPT